MIFSPLNLAVLLEIWVVVVVFRLGSRAFCGTPRYDGDHALALESSSEVCSSEVFLPASLTEDSRVPPLRPPVPAGCDTEGHAAPQTLIAGTGL